MIPGFDPVQQFNVLYTQSPPEQPGKKNPSPEAPAAEAKKPDATDAAGSNRPAWYSIHAQSTFVYDANFPFHDPYDGPIAPSAGQ